MSARNSKRIKRVSLLSSSFSGSTLLSIILCQDKRFFSFGDTYLIPGISDENSLCNCGDTIANCELRTKLGQELKKVNLPESMITKRDLAIPIELISTRSGGERAIAAYQFAGAVLGYKNAYSQYYRREAKFLNAVEEVTGCEFYIDGNKNLVRAHLFSEEDDETLLIHLIRHPFAVLHSAETRHERRGRSIQSRLRNWIFYNRKSQKLCQKFPARSITIYFDDLVRNPKDAVKALSDKFDFGSLDIDTDNLDPTKTHLIGNRSRHNATKVRSKQLAPTSKDLLDLGVSAKEIQLVQQAAESFGIETVP